MADNEVGKFLAQQAVERALEAAEAGEAPEAEYFVSGHAIEMPAGPVPCLLEADNGVEATIVVADGPFTGTTFSVPSSAVTAAEAAYLEQGVKDLFPGVSHVD